MNAKALQGRNAPSTKPHSSKLSWSYDDKLKILNALVMHAQSHNMLWQTRHTFWKISPLTKPMPTMTSKLTTSASLGHGTARSLYKAAHPMTLVVGSLSCLKFSGAKLMKMSGLSQHLGTSVYYQNCILIWPKKSKRTPKRTARGT